MYMNTVIFMYCVCVCSSGMKHREERVVGGEVKPTTTMFGEEEEEDPQVLYDRVSASSCSMYYTYCGIKHCVSVSLEPYTYM